MEMLHEKALPSIAGATVRTAQMTVKERPWNELSTSFGTLLLVQHEPMTKHIEWPICRNTPVPTTQSR